MNPLSIFNVFRGVGDVAKTFVGSKQDRDQQLHDESMSSHQSYSAEFAPRVNRTWWDSLMDGINRVPRPAFVGFIIYYFVLATRDASAFIALNTSLATIPEPMWYILGGVLSFYFGSRHFQKMGEVKTSLAKVKAPGQVLALSEPLPPWYLIAKSEMDSGVAELKGGKHNPQILEYHKATELCATSDETAWCSAFVNWCMMMSGNKRTNKALAKSWLKYGEPLESPREGCVVVFSRGSEVWMGHVGFYVGTKGDHILCLGGNQKDKVSIASYHSSRVLGYRWPI